jgi:hypothetical protein
MIIIKIEIYEHSSVKSLDIKFDENPFKCSLVVSCVKEDERKMCRNL